MKICLNCNKEKPSTEFSKRTKSKDGLQHQCKGCRKLYRLENKKHIVQSSREYYSKNKSTIDDKHKQYRDNNKEVIIERSNTYRTNNREKRLLDSSKFSATKKGIEHTITLADIVIPIRCPYLNIKLTNIINKGAIPTNSSIDRIDNTKGYVKDNIQIISTKANIMKNSSTIEQLITFAKNILKIHPINKEKLI